MRLSIEVDVDTPLSELSAIGRETRSVRRFYSDSVIDGTLNPLFAVVRWSEWKRDQAKIGFALVRLLPHGRAEHRSCAGRAALTCRSRLLRHTPEPCARRPSPSLSPQAFPILWTRRNTLPAVMFAPWSHGSRAYFTHAGIGIVRVGPAFPFRSTMAQCSSRC